MIIQGDYGKRFGENIKNNCPEGWEILEYKYIKKLPIVVDDFSEYLPDKLPECDLLISLQEIQAVAEMIPEMTKMTGAKGVIAPIDNKTYLSSGLARQLKKKLQKDRIEMVHPMTFCTLSEKDTKDELILEFLRYFGKPKVEIEIQMDKVKEVKVLRDAPCGNTRFVAEHLVGCNVKDAVEKSGILHHNHPCYATMTMDAELQDTLMHHAGLQVKLAVEETIKKCKIKK